jgi:dienelactone hydrolase
MLLSCLRRSVSLLRSLGAPAAGAVRPTAGLLRTPLDDYSFDLYRPASSRPASTVIVHHGLSPRGPRDARFIALCGALARNGLRVIAPEIPTMSRLEVSPYCIEEMIAIYGAVNRMPAVADGPVGVFGVSFAGSLALIAADDPRVELPVRSVLCLGAYADLGATLRRMLGVDAAGMDEYVRLVFLYLYFDRLLPGAGNRLREALLRRIEADLDGTDRRAAFLGLTANESAGLERLLDPSDEETARRCAALLEADLPALRRVSPLHRLHACRPSVHLVHGESDPVIPPGQSRLLADRLRRRGADVRCLITPALTHADGGGGGLVGLWGRAQLAGFLAGWLMTLRNDRRSKARSPVAPLLPASSPAALRAVAQPIPLHRRTRHGRDPVGL